MLWLLILHIAALLMWCAMLIFLPVLVAVSPQVRKDGSQLATYMPSVEHFIFTHYATPSALLAIVSGTLVFVANGITEPWLIVKLSAVTGLVICHALLGLLILRAQIADRSSPLEGSFSGRPATIRTGSYLILAVVSCLIASVIWLVLAKPTLDWFQ